MRPDTFTAPFVARGLFKPKNLWYGKYHRFDFHSDKITTERDETVQFQSLKRLVDNTLNDMCYQLTIFDNRRNSVQYKGNIIYMQVNGHVINEVYRNLSFMEWTFDPGFCMRMSRSFNENIHNVGKETIIERETILEESHTNRWNETITMYKQEAYKWELAAKGYIKNT